MVRRHLFTTLAGVAAVTLCAPLAFAQCSKSQADSCQASKLQCLDGKVKSLDAKTRAAVITVGKDKEAKDVKLTVCPKAKIQVDGKAAKLDAVKVGTAVKLCTVKSEKAGLIAIAVTIGKGDCPNKAKCSGATCGAAISSVLLSGCSSAGGGCSSSK